ncbi:MAG: tetratricopeptide repeat protein, partial [Planctomycetota bacterium]|nr:tetratricopeptide repeat protein [Planctomycetota bacterium]
MGRGRIVKELHMKGTMGLFAAATLAGLAGIGAYAEAGVAGSRETAQESKVEYKTWSCFNCGEMGRAWKRFFVEEFRRGKPLPEGYDKVDLALLRQRPRFYQDRKVQFPIYFAGKGSFYQPYFSPFSADTHVNFCGWSYGAQLWTKADRADVFPFLYMERKNTELAAELDRIPKYAPLMVYGRIVQVSGGQPWIAVDEFRRIKEAVHSDLALRQVELGIKRIEKENDHALAAQAFEAAIEEGLPPMSEAKIQGYLGKSYVHLRRYAEARKALESALSRDPDNPELLLLLARTYIRLDKPDLARDVAEAALRLQPSNPYVRADLGLAIALCGEPREGLKECSAALRLNPKLPEALFNRAKIYRMMKRYEEAIEDLIQAVLLRPNDMEFHLELGDIELVEMKRPDKALDEYENVITVAKDRPEGYTRKASVLWTHKKEAKTAIEMLKQAVKVDETYLPAQ